jgi:hypothetical protein
MMMFGEVGCKNGRWMELAQIVSNDYDNSGIEPLGSATSVDVFILISN